MAFPQEQLFVVRRLFPNARIFNNYGLAEAMPRLTLRPAEDADDAANIGQPLPGVELHTGDLGEFTFRSPYGAVGVVDRDGFREITGETWVGTGDLGVAIGDGAGGSRAGRVRCSTATAKKSRCPCCFRLYCETGGARRPSTARLTPAARTGTCCFSRHTRRNRKSGGILKTFAAEFGRAHWPLRGKRRPDSLAAQRQGRYGGRIET